MKVVGAKVAALAASPLSGVHDYGEITHTVTEAIVEGTQRKAITKFLDDSEWPDAEWTS